MFVILTLNLSPELPRFWGQETYNEDLRDCLPLLLIRTESLLSPFQKFPLFLLLLSRVPSPLWMEGVLRNLFLSIVTRVWRFNILFFPLLGSKEINDILLVLVQSLPCFCYWSFYRVARVLCRRHPSFPLRREPVSSGPFFPDRYPLSVVRCWYSSVETVKLVGAEGGLNRRWLSEQVPISFDGSLPQVLVMSF